MISLTSVDKLYKQGNTVMHALKGINLQIAQGQIFGILGRQGSGKSALIRCINLLESPDRGSVVVDSCELNSLDVKSLREARRNIGMIFEHFNLLYSRTVYENIALPLEIMGYASTQIEAGVRPLLDLIGLSHKADAPIDQLNAGQKQMVAIAKALASKPKVLLCEQATAALDPKAKQSVLALLKAVQKTLHTTIVLITHEVDVIKSLCDRVAILHQGTIVEENSTTAFFTHPQSEIGRDFIRSAARAEIPSSLANTLKIKPMENYNPILRISFDDPSTQGSFVAALVQQFHLRVNILQAHLETIQNKNMGLMLIEAMGDMEEVKRAIQFLEQNNIYVEVLAYAPRTA
jgi:D-methionine transport system ATP-binding protein